MSTAIDAATRVGHGHGVGKVIVLGEHAVVYGYPALVAGVAQGVTLRARPMANAIDVEVPSWGLGRGEPPAAVTAASRAIIARFGWPGAAIDGEANLPAGAGLGSSAAYCVALVRACAAHDGLSLTTDEVIAAASHGEASFHGTPSGVDVAAATYGGLGTFCKPSGFTPWAPSSTLGLAIASPRLVVGITGIARATSTMIERVAARAATPEGMANVGRLGALAASGIEALRRGDLGTLGAAMFEAHATLAALDASHASLDAMVQAAARLGAVGAKLTGAGGGGSAIALAPGREAEVTAGWQQMGYSTLMVTLGAMP